MEVSKKLRGRDLYLHRLIAFRDKEPVKVITGLRRSGKSSLLQLMRQYLLDTGVDVEQIIFMNFESIDYQSFDEQGFYDFIKGRIMPGKKMYFFFDEVQLLSGWHRVVNSFRVDFDCDIYVTGSNAYLLSSELATYLAGRYVEIKILPLSFREYLEFHDYRIEKYLAPSGKEKIKIIATDGAIGDLWDMFEAYMRFGGLPGTVEYGFNQENIMTYLDGIYSAVVVRDILERGWRSDERQVCDAELLRKITMFLADNVGNNVSLTSVSNTLAHEQFLREGGLRKPAVQTVQAYVRALLDAFVFYETKRFDIKGKGYLRSLGKYYLADVGLRSYLLGDRQMDIGHILENIVYLELLRRGYDVAVGKIGDKEIDFIAIKQGEKQYIQVAAQLGTPETLERELSALRSIRNNCPKTVLCLQPYTGATEDGILIQSVYDFLLA